MNHGNWTGSRNYRIVSKGVTGGTEETPGTPVAFVVDSNGPVATPITPTTLAYINSLTTLSANITDIAPGLVSAIAGDVYFTVKEVDSNLFWNWRMFQITGEPKFRENSDRSVRQIGFPDLRS